MKYLVMFLFRLIAVVIYSVFVLVFYYPFKFLYLSWHLKLEGYPTFREMFGTEDSPFYQVHRYIEPDITYVTMRDYLLNNKKIDISETIGIEDVIEILVNKQNSKK